MAAPIVLEKIDLRPHKGKEVPKRVDHQVSKEFYIDNRALGEYGIADLRFLDQIALAVGWYRKFVLDH